MTVGSGSTARMFLLSTPPVTTPQEALPLVVNLPGLAYQAAIASVITGFDTLGEREGFLTATAQGTGEPVNWEADPDPAHNPDLIFINSLIDRVESDRCIDRSRVYVVGMSSGAMLASAIACTMSDRVAAIAAVGGVAYPDGCDPARAVPVLAIHGSADPLIHFHGGIGLETIGALARASDRSQPVKPPPTSTTTPTSTTIPRVELDGKGAPAAVRAWAAHNDCTSKPADEELTADVVIRTYPCPAGHDVRFFVVKGGGSSWPGSEPGSKSDVITGRTTFSFNATKVIWSFFAGQQLPGA